MAFRKTTNSNGLPHLLKVKKNVPQEIISNN